MLAAANKKAIVMSKKGDYNKAMKANSESSDSADTALVNRGKPRKTTEKLAATKKSQYLLKVQTTTTKYLQQIARLANLQLIIIRKEIKEKS